ncbi:MAG: HtaA domain-containing protein [Corynebacterium glucuronolyticum]|nr:HtaA domain-containing protein [Corynebacterium glucuronolyticum]
MTVLTRPLTVSALALATLVTPLPAVADTPAAPIAIESGDLDWPIKESWIQYLNMKVFKPQINVGDGATYVPKSKEFPGTFQFELDPATSSLDADGNGVLHYMGTMHFLSHPLYDDPTDKTKITSWGLDITMTNVTITITDGTKAMITVDLDAVGGMPGVGQTETHEKGVDFASFTLDKPLQPAYGTTVTVTDRPTVFQPIVEQAFLTYKPGPVKDGDVDMKISFQKEKAPDPTGSSEAETIGAAVGGTIAALLALLGLAAAAAANGLIHLPAIHF